MSASIAVSSWSLHRTLGAVAVDAFPWGGSMAHASDGLDLLDLPAALATRGFRQLQLCHFHVPSRDPSYLAELRGALADADVTLDAVLLDTGDLTSPVDGDDVEQWVRTWLEDATVLGADKVRVIAGRQAPTDASISVSATRLRRLASAVPTVRLVTENWHELVPDAARMLQLLDETAGDVGFLIDLGNWTGETKYEALAAVAARAETCHAKCGTRGDGTLDEDDYEKSLGTLVSASFDGTLALVHDGPLIPEWDALAAERAIVQKMFAIT